MRADRQLRKTSPFRERWICEAKTERVYNGGIMSKKPKTKTNDPGAHHASSGALIRRFLPYLANYKMVLCLICSAQR